MKKILFTFILSFISFSMWADVKGSCGENLTWTFVESSMTLTISGSGEMDDNDLSPWWNFRDSIHKVVIEKGCTSIGECAFWDCEGLTSITIPESVTSIGSSAFSCCSNLTTITIPEGVTSIGSYAFVCCSGLTSITIPEGVTSIGSSAFRDCSGLTSVTIPRSLTSIGDYAFYGCRLQNILATSPTPLNSNETFSEPTLYHAILYVPAGSWVDYAYHDSWYKFINIKEIALSQDQVMTRQPVMLMDTRTFAYSVYDPVNEKIGSINPASINEDNLYHSWQMIESDGNSFLYNIGAKKFAKRGRIGLEITDTPTPIDVVDGEKGIILGGQSINQWALVTNRSLIADESIITGIGPLLPQEPSPNWYYNLNGQQTNRTTKGINIIRLSDGTVKKVMIK